MAEEQSSEIGALWEEALCQYYDITKMTIKKPWTIESIKLEQEGQVQRFTGFRHDGKGVDKIRSAISKNSKIILAVAQNVSDAAVASFPPSAAIMTAFTYVMKASRNVSDDYDMILSFYDIMGSLLERISILEDKLPTAKDYKRILTRVFSSMLVLCGKATKAVHDERLKAWFKALYKGQDTALKASYDTLNKHIQDLESATFFATLATTIEIKSDVKELQSEIKGNTVLHMQSIKLQSETNVMMKEEITISRRLLSQFEQMQKSQDDGKGGSNKGNVKDSGSKRTAALNQVRKSFFTLAKPEVQFSDLQKTYVEKTFAWVDSEAGYKAFREKNSPFLWIYGKPGTGKSVLAYTIVEKLQKSFQENARISVSYFFFKEEHEELRSVKDMLFAIVAQIATMDGIYREAVAADLKSNKADFADDWTQVWNRFFSSKYPEDGVAKLYLILDGLDEVDSKGRAKLFEVLKLAKDKKTNIQIILTSRPGLEPDINALSPAKIELTMSKLSTRSGDLWKIILARCKNLPKLRRLKLPGWKKIVPKLREKADSILYCEHVLRRLNSIGHEKLIMAELKKLPPNLPSLYSLMLSDCQKGRAPEQVEALKKLFAWLAYSKRPLTLGEATCLVAVVEQNTTLSLEEEIDGRSARILELAINPDDEKSSDESDSAELTEKDDVDIFETREISSMSSLRFQERSMKQYFREMEVDEKGLRSSPSSAHLTIFEMAVGVLNLSIDNEDVNGVRIAWEVREYAANFWLQHFSEVSPDKATVPEIKRVINALRVFMSPEGKSLRSIEMFFESESDLFWGSQELREGFFDSLKKWSQRANDLPVGALSNEDLAWIQDFSVSAEVVLLELAKGHVRNWLSANKVWRGTDSLRFAVSALRMTNIAVGLTKESSIDDLSIDTIHATADAFPEIDKTPTAYRAIGWALSQFDHPEAALLSMATSLDNATTDFDRFYTLGSVADIELKLSELEKYKDSKEVHIRKAYESVNAGLAQKPFVTTEKDPKNSDEIFHRSLIQTYLETRAKCEVMLGNLDAALATMDESRAALTDSIIDEDINDLIMAALEKQASFEKMLSAIERFNKWEKIFWLGWGNVKANERLQHAAKMCRKKDTLIRIYENVIKEGEKFFGLSPRLRLQLATVHQTVFPDYAKAKVILYEIIDGKTGGRSSDEGYAFEDLEFVSTARLNLTDILMDEFRAANTPEEKTKLFKEMSALARRNGLEVGDDFSPYESQTAIPLALMARKLGPVSEFQDITEKVFAACIKDLSDEISSNDCAAFRLLAKVLACVVGLEKEAQIAISCQFSVVDKKLLQPVDDSSAPSTDILEGDKPEEVVDSSTNKPTTSILAGAKTSDGSEENPLPAPKDHSSAQTNDVKEEPIQDLDSSVSITCNGCEKSFKEWNQGPIYTCVICTECNLCQECYDRRAKLNNHEIEDEWRTFCGVKHHYIRGPVEGWKGVKNGFMRWGDVDIEFTKWRDELSETKWKDIWGRFWTKEDFEGDIL